jgi:predicted MFS family arabinose efflux permease
MRNPSGAAQEFRLSWRIVLVALIGVAFGGNGFSYASFSILVNPLSEAFGRPVSAISVWVTFLFLGNIVLSPAIGVLADRYGARRVVLWAFPLFILAWALGGTMGPHLALLYLLAACVGSIGAAVGPLTYSRVVNTWFDAGRGTALGIMSAGIGLSYLVGPPLVQRVVDAHGWRVGFFFIAAVHLIPLPFIVAWLHERREKVERGPRPVETGLTIRQVVRMPAFWYASAGFVLYGLCAGGVTVNLVPFLTASGLTRSHAAFYMSLLGIFSMTGRVVTGYIIDRLPVGPTCAAILLLEGAAFASFAIWGASIVPIAIAVTGFAFGGEVSCMGYAIARYFGVRHYGAINGLLSIMTGVGVGLGPPLIGLLHESSGSYRLPFFVAAGIAGAAAVFFVILALYPYYDADTENAVPAAGGAT